MKPKKRVAISSSRVLSSAECARRTGLTVRTLRVYERAGLIKPQRGANGWRVYGESEVRRLNYIITLKGLGLTLREIREMLTSAGPPPLVDVLQLQLKSWLARQSVAEQALKVVRAALERLAEKKTLSIDELCDLARRTETIHSLNLSTWRELVNQMITPEEERAYANWWASRPGESACAMKEFSEAQRSLFGEMEVLRAKGAEPASPKVQALIDRHRELMNQYRVREQLVDLMQWNPTLTRKYIAVGQEFRARTLNAEKVLADPTGKSLFEFFIAAVRTSKVGQAFHAILTEAKALCGQQVEPSSPAALKLAKRLKELCRRFKLGNPVSYALSAAFLGRVEREGERQPLDEADQAPYRFLAEAASV